MVIRMRSGRAFRTTLFCGVFALVAASVTPATAQDDVEAPPDPVGGPLEIGPWTAAANASGQATASEGGMQLTWTGNIPAQFTFGVADDGRATGTWTHQGSAVFEFSGTSEGQSIDATADVSMSGGGSVSGNNTQLTLEGTSTNTGTMTGTVAGRSMTMPINNTQPTSPMTVSVRSTVCDEAYGDWEYTVEAGFRGEGWATASFSGHWLGYRDTAGVQEHLDDLLDQAAMGGDDMPDFSSSGTPLMAKTAELLWRYNDFVDDYPNWAIGDVINAMEWAELLINELRNLTECDLKMFGEDQVEIFTNGLTLMIQQLVMGILEVGDVDSTAWQTLAQVAARTGAIGAGSQYPEAAAAAEAALIEAGSKILTDNLDEDGLVDVTDDTKRVMATGAAMGWEYDVGGTIYDARASFDDYLAAGGTE